MIVLLINKDTSKQECFHIDKEEKKWLIEALESVLDESPMWKKIALLKILTKIADVSYNESEQLSL